MIVRRKYPLGAPLPRPASESDEAVRAWVRRIAASLPPMTDAEIRQVAALVVRVDARRRAAAFADTQDRPASADRAAS